MKTCSICNQTKPVTDYYQQKGKYMKRCKECQKTYARLWAAMHYEKALRTREKYGLSSYRTKQATHKENHDEVQKSQTGTR
jgi:hypothetical protein